MPLLSALHAVQDAHGFLPPEQLDQLACRYGLSPAELDGFVSFFSGFRTHPLSENSLRVCTGPSCRMAGLVDALSAPGAVPAPCLGRCDQAPVTLAANLATNLAEDDEAPVYPPGHWDWLGQFVVGAQRTRLLATLEASSLTGMGGAGFPMYRKMATVAAASAPTKYVIANADEGEPGTFKDRDLIRRHPDEILAGVVLACRLTGASRGYVYIRHDYPKAYQKLLKTVEQMEGDGLINGGAPSSLMPSITVVRGGGAYICGEESALIASLEGRRGEPSPGPPYPAEQGLFDAPTLVQNVETLLYLSRIARNGADWYRQGGVGRRHFSVSGAVQRPGVYEHPCDVTAATVLAAAGGLTPGDTLKAFIPGGASSGFLPPSALNTDLTNEALAPLDSVSGTGGIVFIPESACLIDLATGLMDFFADESCGQCDPCRLGTATLAHGLGGLKQGRVMPQSQMVETANAMATLSICGLGQWSPLVLTSLLRHFPDDITAHGQGVCPAGICSMGEGS
jgi:formate dehydrogenase